MDDLLVYAFRSALCLAVFYALYWLFLRQEAFFGLNRLYLLGTAALSLVLPLFHVTSPFTTRTVSPLTPELLVAVEAPSRRLSFFDVLLILYLVGAGAFLLRFAHRLGRLLWTARTRRGERWRGMRVVWLDHQGAPFSFFSTLFLDRSAIPGNDLSRILAHEMAHVRQRHSLDILLLELLSIVQWFNPFVWPYKRSLRETHEYLADRAVIAQGCPLARYQLLIVEQTVGGKLFEYASNFRNSQIKRRLTMLSRKDSKGLARLKPLLILPLALVLVLVFAEARIVAAGSDSAVPEPARSGLAAAQEKTEESKPEKDLPPEELLKIKSEKLAEMQKNCQEKLTTLKEKLEEAQTAEEKERILKDLRLLKLKDFELSHKEVLLNMKVLELKLAAEKDPKMREQLEKKLQMLKQKDSDMTKKLEEIKKAECCEPKKDTEADKAQDVDKK